MPKATHDTTAALQVPCQQRHALNVIREKENLGPSLDTQGYQTSLSPHLCYVFLNVSYKPDLQGFILSTMRVTNVTSYHLWSNSLNTFGTERTGLVCSPVQLMPNVEPCRRPSEMGFRRL